MSYLDPRDPRYTQPQPGWQPPQEQYPPATYPRHYEQAPPYGQPHAQPGYPPQQPAYPPPTQQQPGYPPAPPQPPYGGAAYGQPTYPQQPYQASPQQPYPAGSGYPPPVPPRRRKTNTVLLIVIFGVLALCGAGIAIAAATDHSTTPGATGTTGPGAQPTTTLDTLARIIAWRDNGGQAVLSALAKDTTALGDAGQQADFAAAHAACVSLKVDVGKARAYGPLPDAVAQQHWSAALTDFGKAADDCAASTHNFDANRMTKAATELEQATTEIGAVTARFKQLGG